MIIIMFIKYLNITLFKKSITLCWKNKKKVIIKKATKKMITPIKQNTVTTPTNNKKPYFICKKKDKNWFKA